jgi:N-formylglutamate amidohydrolase
MPASKAPPAIVFGDRYGRSAAPWLMADSTAIAAEAGFTATANDPFAGGHILDRHGSPQNSVHAIQVEIDRRCYLAPDGEPSEGFDSVAALIETLAVGLGSALLAHRPAAAAE